MTEREPSNPVIFRPMRKIGVVLYALFMALVHSHYITAQLYLESDYFFSVWYGVSDAQLWTGETLAILANIGLLLSPFLAAPRPAMRLLMLASLAVGAIIAIVHLAHMLSIHAFRPFWPTEPIDAIYIGMFIDSLFIYSIDIIGIYLYLSRSWRLCISTARRALE